jgi:hypothetical protein
MLIAKLQSPLNQFDNNTIRLPANDTSRTLALLITWYDLLVQFAIGLLFLPCRKITDRLGHIVLQFFIYTTYLPAPVFGFGWTLSIYGFTLARSQSLLTPLAYVGAFLAVLCYQAPWREWVLSW